MSETDFMLDLFEVSDLAGMSRRQTGDFLIPHPAPNSSAALHAQLLQTAKLAEIGLNFAEMVHELRQPMSSIYGFAQLVGERPESPHAAEWAQEIVLQCRRMQSMLEDLRRFCRSDAVKETEWLSPREALDAALELVPRMRPGLTISVDFPGRDVSIRANKSGLTQIFWNLILNARDAMSQRDEEQDGADEFHTRPGDIQIRCRVEDGGGAVFSVLDQGCGVPDEIKNSLFDPFMTTKGDRGTGLGLYICGNLATSMGATLRLGTAPEGYATCFQLAFPPESVR